MMPSQNGAGQIIEPHLTIRASIPLARRLSVIVTIPGHRGTVAMGTADAGRPAMLADQLIKFGIVDQRRQSNQRHHRTNPLLAATPSLNRSRRHPSRNPGHHSETPKEPFLILFLVPRRCVPWQNALLPISAIM